MERETTMSLFIRSFHPIQLLVCALRAFKITMIYLTSLKLLDAFTLISGFQLLLRANETGWTFTYVSNNEFRIQRCNIIVIHLLI
jgi:hypothetical protein